MLVTIVWSPDNTVNPRRIRLGRGIQRGSLLPYYDDDDEYTSEEEETDEEEPYYDHYEYGIDDLCVIS